MNYAIIKLRMIEKVFHMNWSEVRELYPNQFVKFEILKSHIENEQEIVDELAVIGPVDAERATEELLKSRGNTLVYHTSRGNISMQRRTRIGLRKTI
jgi:RNA-binding protein YhbY